MAGIFLIMDTVERALEKPLVAELVAESSTTNDSPGNDQQPLPIESGGAHDTTDQAPNSADIHPLDR